MKHRHQDPALGEPKRLVVSVEDKILLSLFHRHISDILLVEDEREENDST
jgi:hypothetical protein